MTDLTTPPPATTEGAEDMPQRYWWDGPDYIVQVQVDDPTPRFLLSDLCAALDVPVSAPTRWMPPHMVRKITTQTGKQASAINVEGLFLLFGYAATVGAGRNRSHSMVGKVLIDAKGEYVHMGTGGTAERIARSAMYAITAVMETYPQKDRKRPRKGRVGVAAAESKETDAAAES